MNNRGNDRTNMPEVLHPVYVSNLSLSETDMLQKWPHIASNFNMLIPNYSN